MIALPAAFVLALGARSWRTTSLLLAALGIGSGLILDEMTYLIATRGSDEDYVSRVSLFGAIAFISLAVMLLLALYRLRRSSRGRRLAKSLRRQVKKPRDCQGKQSIVRNASSRVPMLG